MRSGQTIVNSRLSRALRAHMHTRMHTNARTHTRARAHIYTYARAHSHPDAQHTRHTHAPLTFVDQQSRTSATNTRRWSVCDLLAHPRALSLALATHGTEWNGFRSSSTQHFLWLRRRSANGTTKGLVALIPTLPPSEIFDLCCERLQQAWAMVMPMMQMIMDRGEWKCALLCTLLCTMRCAQADETHPFANSHGCTQYGKSRVMQMESAMKTTAAEEGIAITYVDVAPTPHSLTC
jgi:hypothetical protein